MDKKRLMRISLVILILIFTFILVYSPHFSYKYPYHGDEWRHLIEARNLNEGNYVCSFKYDYQCLEIGFHIFLAVLSKIFDIIIIYKFLPALFACIASLILFFLVYKSTENFWIGILSMIFFASIKSNIYILGLWFFVPLTLSIPLIYLFLLFFTESIEKDNNKRLVLSFIIYLGILIIHPPSGLIMIPLIFIYSLINYKFFIKNLWRFYIVAGLIFILTYFGYLFFRVMRGPYEYIQYITDASKFFSIDAISEFVKLFIFKYGWAKPEIPINLMWGYSIIGVVLAVIGFIYLFKKGFFKKRYLIFVFFTLTTLVQFLLFNPIKFTILAPYQRIFYYLLISLPILSAIGTYYIIKLVREKLKDLMIKKYIINGVILFIIIFVIFFSFKDYYDSPKEAKLVKYVDDNDYKALKFLREYDSSDATVLADFNTSMALSFISGHKTPKSGFFENNMLIVIFFRDNIDEDTKLKMIKENNITYIYSKRLLEDGMYGKLIYDDKIYIYELEK